MLSLSLFDESPNASKNESSGFITIHLYGSLACPHALPSYGQGGSSYFHGESYLIFYLSCSWSFLIEVIVNLLLP
jgi:hypothetical protein